MARELNKNVEYEICLVAPSLRGEPDGLTEVWVKLEDSNTGNVYYLPKAEFMNRKFEMQEIYQDYLDGNPEWDNSTEGTVKSTRPTDPVKGFTGRWRSGIDLEKIHFIMMRILKQ